jgi:RND family efflux transporter MFP subunit
MLKKLSGVLLIIIAIATVVVLVKNKPRPETKAEPSKTSITLLVKEVSPSLHPMVIQAEGFVSSKWQTTLSSQVTGRVIEVSDKLLVGNRFKQGDVLVKIEPLDYQVQVARAQANLKSAESALVEQQMQSERAKSDWNKLNPTRQPSDFNLRLPQLKSAQSNLQAAKDELRLAEENLSRTQIKAPFDGFSVSRNIDLGEQLQMGGVVAEIVGSQTLELKIALTTSQATLLEQAADTQFKFNPTVNTEGADLNVSNIRFEPFIDSQNRWRSMVLELESDEITPLVGDFLKLEIIAQQTMQMLAVPESALSIDGRIWYVDGTNTAQFFRPEIIYKNSGNLYLASNDEMTYPISLVVSPPNSLLRGTEVSTESWQATSVTE